MKTPLNDIISHNKEHISFHTPAHGGVIDNDILTKDITELSFSDNLLSPNAVIYHSQQQVSKVYGTDRTMYITTGATTAVHIAIHALRQHKFLAVGNIHKSVFNAFRLYNIDSYYGSDVNILTDYILDVRPTALIVTSPDYFGNTLNLKNISDIAKQHNIILIIDASHGSHFVFSDKLPVSATKYGDIVIHSCHKTLPVLTGGAMLHYKDCYHDILSNSQNLIHTTSPSYMILCHMEKAIYDLSIHGQEIYSQVLLAIDNFGKRLPKDYTIVSSKDITRLVISSPYTDLAIQLEKFGIFAEMSYNNLVVFIITPNNFRYLDKLAEALDKVVCQDIADNHIVPISISRAVALRFYDDFYFVDIDKAVGLYSYREIGLYPPGVPIILSGQKLTAIDITFINRHASRLFGLDKGRIAVVK